MDVPAHLARRPSHDGLPIPYTTAIDSDGVPNFARVDPVLRLRAMRERLCSLCGVSLSYWKVVPVTSLTLSARTVFTSPMHEECFRYAITVCPFLARREYEHSALTEGMKLLRSGDMEPKPPQIGIAFLRNYRITEAENGIDYVTFSEGSIGRVEWVDYGEEPSS